MPNFYRVVLAIIAFNLIACASQTVEVALNEVEPAKLAEEIEKADSKIEENETFESKITAHPDLQIELNERVEKWVRIFTTTHRDVFRRFLARGSRYKEVVQETFRSQGIPEELYYLGMIESGYRPRAVSRAKCVGIWQFGKATAKDYGLKVRHGLDQRQDPLLSTRAAGRYLKSLRRTFGSWHLAIAAYNSGPGRVAGAIKKGDSRDFWTLIERKVLPMETMEYVPQFFAATLIGENPEKYGFDLSKDDCVLPEDAVRTPAKMQAVKTKPAGKIYRVSRGDTLLEISQRFGVSVKRIKLLNRLRSSVIYRGQKLRLPAV